MTHELNTFNDIVVLTILRGTPLINTRCFSQNVITVRPKITEIIIYEPYTNREVNFYVFSASSEMWLRRFDAHFLPK